MKLYAYCLSDEPAAGTVQFSTGIGGARTYMIQSGDFAAVVSDLESEPVEITRDNVLAHERVVRGELAQGTPLPFRFGTVVTEAELESYVNTHSASLKRQLDHVRGCVEMSVKIIWNQVARDKDAPRGAQPDQESTANETKQGTGTAFLVAKQLAAQGDKTLTERADEIAAWLTERLGDSIRDAVVNVQPAQALVLAAAHLVPRERLEQYRAALGAARSERPELHFLTSGAWPPYSFTIINS